MTAALQRFVLLAALLLSGSGLAAVPRLYRIDEAYLKTRFSNPALNLTPNATCRETL
ncbi:MAG: hypothetical protein OEQ14_08170 [Gammaproteobacteria bacterium]|nr:hypothetical protein [Gammaproteobacteria bacterium]